MTNLALKHRPQCLEQVIGQPTAVTQLTNQLNEILQLPDSPVQPIIFSGLHGTGKTTLGRIVAKYLNCKSPKTSPCNCDVCQQVSRGTFVDFIELDAASNNGVDDIRQLNELSYTKPLNSFKVFLIDEAHQLSKAAWNALLKSLEEPPERIVYILATTELNKIIPTVLSRCLLVKLFPVGKEDLTKHISDLILAESLSSFLDVDEVVEFIVTQARGSVRDAIKTLGSVIASGAVSMEEIQTKFGLADMLDYEQLVKHLVGGDLGATLVKLEELKKTGTEPKIILEKIYELVTDILHHCAGSKFTVLNPPEYYSENYNLTLSQANTLLGAFLEVQNLSFGNITINLLNYAVTKYYLASSGQPVLAPTGGGIDFQSRTKAKPTTPASDMLAKMQAVQKPTPAAAIASATDPAPEEDEEEWF